MTVLLTRLQNIGDTLVYVPALRAIRTALPDAHIIHLAKHAGGRAVLENCPYIDETIVVQKRGLREKLRLIRAFRKRKIDWFVISPQDLGRVPWAFLGGAKHIAGFTQLYNHEKWRKEKCVWLMDTPLTYDHDKTEIENCLLLAGTVIDACGNDKAQFCHPALEYSWTTAEDAATAQSLLQKNGIAKGQSYIVSAPLSKREAKNWPLDRWRELFRRLHDTWHMPIILLGGAYEKPRCEKCADNAHVISLAGDTSLKESAALMSTAKLFVGPDSGPAFLATAVGIPVVAMYGPADYTRWRVPESAAPNRIELHHEFSCAPCRHQECPQAERCMDSFTVEEVYAACNELIQKDTQ